MTYFEILNAIFEAHRNKDVVLKHILIQKLDETEVEYADTLDLMKV